MNKIHRLDKLLIAQIAAGEVIENPQAVLKELLENSLDADANQIDILVRNNGFDKIEVRDNGLGIERDDLALAVESFSTSKLQSLDDLNQMLTLGFRGEALGSMRSMGHLCIESKRKGANLAYHICAEREFVSEISPCALPQGTRIILSNLFAHTPARKKFQKKDALLQKELLDVFFTYALGFFSCGFLYDDAKKQIQIPAQKNMLERILQIYPQHRRQNFFTVYAEKNNATLQGYVSDFSIQKNNRSHIFFFVGNRPVSYPPLVKILTQVYGEMLPTGKFPLAVLHYHPPLHSIDVNVHPGKKEIRFHEEAKVKDFFYTALKHCLSAEGAIKHTQVRSKVPRHKPDDSTNMQENPFSPFANTNFIGNMLDKNFLSLHSFPQETEGFLAESFSYSAPPKFNLPHACKFYGRLFNTFAVFACEDSLLLMDQHTAFERIAYEQMLRKIAAQEDIRQQLLTPLSLQLSASENSFVDFYREQFFSLGFVLQNLGPAGFSLLAVPHYISGGQEQEAFFNALQIFKENEEKNFPKDILFQELAASLACRGAIKKGDEISAAALQEAFSELMKCKEPFRCPHGRPTVVQIPRDEIFLWFNRTGSRAK